MVKVIISIVLLTSQASPWIVDIFNAAFLINCDNGICDGYRKQQLTLLKKGVYN